MTVVALSGGKDSTAMLHLMLEHGKSVDKVYFFDTGWEFPCMGEHLRQIEKNTGIHIEKLCYYRRFDDLLKLYGWPKTSGGWCTACKRDTSIKYERAVHADVVCIGFAADEVHRTERPTVQAKRKWRVEYPLIDWGITEAKALQYCYELGYRWNGLYEVFNRLSCFCCPKAGKKRIAVLQEQYPDLYAEYQRKNQLAERRKE